MSQSEKPHDVGESIAFIGLESARLSGDNLRNLDIIKDSVKRRETDEHARFMESCKDSGRVEWVRRLKHARSR